MKTNKNTIDEYCVDSQPIGNWEETEEGYIKLWISVAVANKDLEYFHEDGTKRIEYIDENDLFDPESLKTAIAKPFTINHPPEPVLINNHRKYSHGTTLQEIINDSGRLTVASVITDPDTCQKIKSKEIKYTSSAYRALKIPQDDGRLKQTKRRYNHFALLTDDNQPRAGIDSCIILDSKGNEPMTTQENTPATTTTHETEINQPTMKEMFDAITGLGEAIKTALGSVPSTATVPVPVTENVDSKNETTNATENIDSKSETKECVRLWSEWKSIVEMNNKTVDFNLDSEGVKRLVLSCFYDEAIVKKLDTTQKLDGFWLNFEANKDSFKKTKKTTKNNQDAEDPRERFIRLTTQKTLAK
jgi:hypothetical protein